MAAQGVSAASLLSSGEASGVPSALRAVLAGGDEAIQAFSQAFGPRRLLRLLSKSSPSPELEQLADAVLSACAKGAGEGELGMNNFSTSQDLGVLHKDSMYPDRRIALTRPLYDHPLPEAAEWRSAVRLWLPMGDAEHVNASRSESQAFFFPSYVAILRQGMAAGSVTEATAELTLTTPSRRACMGEWQQQPSCSPLGALTCALAPRRGGDRVQGVACGNPTSSMAVVPRLAA